MKIKLLLFTLLLSLFYCDTMSAQRKKTPSKKSSKAKEKAKEKEEETDLLEKWNVDIRLGNVAISQGFALSVKPGVGYKVTDFLTGGVGTRVFFNYYNYAGTEATLLDYGGFIFGRAKLKNFYIQGEYASTKFEPADGYSAVVTYPLAGLGYMYSGDKWKYGFELMAPLNKDARSYGPPLEYWINISYNF